MEKYNDTQTKSRLCAEVEAAIGRKLATPKDFDFLRNQIFSRLHIFISATTLKRIWGYLTDDVSPRRSTLDILARYLGYIDYDTFATGVTATDDELSSNPIMSRRIDVEEQLDPGDRIRLTWQPGRVCDVEYRGSNAFEVVASQGTRLKPGDTFKCALIIEAEPLYIDHLVTGDSAPTAYVCGKKSGVCYELLPPQ